jgi:hypothetical protein
VKTVLDLLGAAEVCWALHLSGVDAYRCVLGKGHQGMCRSEGGHDFEQRCGHREGGGVCIRPAFHVEECVLMPVNYPLVQGVR